MTWLDYASLLTVFEVCNIKSVLFDYNGTAMNFAFFKCIQAKIMRWCLLGMYYYPIILLEICLFLISKKLKKFLQLLWHHCNGNTAWYFSIVMVQQFNNIKSFCFIEYGCFEENWEEGSTKISVRVGA